MQARCLRLLDPESSAMLPHAKPTHDVLAVYDNDDQETCSGAMLLCVNPQIGGPT